MVELIPVQTSVVPAIVPPVKEFELIVIAPETLLVTEQPLELLTTQ